MSTGGVDLAGGVPPLGPGDYLRFSKLAEERFGLHFPEKRRFELERGVRQAFAASTCADLEEYYRLLQDPSGSAFHVERLVNALTISETHFFRDAGQFEALRRYVLPQIIERRRALRTMRIWSAGCASGEEPYSIAILLRELLPDVDEWSVTILGTDLNTESLARARAAVYSDWAFREEEAKQLRQRYFRQQGSRYELLPEVRSMVTFALLNLVEDAYPAYETNTTFLDLILCRNVTIYFTDLVTHRVVDRLYDALVEGGWLVVGHSEHSLATYRRFQTHNFPGAIIYQRVGQPTAPPGDWEWAREAKEVLAAGGVSAPSDAAPSPLLEVSTPEAGDPVEAARELIAYGHSERARDELLQLVKSGLGCATVYGLLGQVYANLGHWEEAEHWCREAVRVDRLALQTYYTLALVLQHRGQLDQAVEAMRKVVYINRHYVLGHFGLADLYHASGQLSKALKSLDNAGRLLSRQAADTPVPGADGLTVGRLREAIIRQQQRWSAEAVDDAEAKEEG